MTLTWPWGCCLESFHQEFICAWNFWDELRSKLGGDLCSLFIFLVNIFYLQNISEQGWYFLHPLPFYNRLLYTTQVQLAIKFHNLALWRPGSDENSLFMLRVIFLRVDCQLQHYHAHELQGASTDEQGGVPSERTFWKRLLHQICLQYSDVVSKSGMSSSSRVQLRAKMLEEKVRCKRKENLRPIVSTRARRAFSEGFQGVFCNW